MAFNPNGEANGYKYDQLKRPDVLILKNCLSLLPISDKLGEIILYTFMNVYMIVCETGVHVNRTWNLGRSGINTK